MAHGRAMAPAMGGGHLGGWVGKLLRTCHTDVMANVQHLLPLTLPAWIASPTRAMTIPMGFPHDVSLDDGSSFPFLRVLGSGAETVAYSLPWDAESVILLVKAGSVDKDVMGAMAQTGKYAHVLPMTYLGREMRNDKKVYRCPKVTGIGDDPDGIAYSIRSVWPNKYDRSSEARILMGLRHDGRIPRSILRTLVGMLRRYRAHGANPHLDLHNGNFATMDGEFILLDPFYRGFGYSPDSLSPQEPTCPSDFATPDPSPDFHQTCPTPY